MPRLRRLKDYEVDWHDEDTREEPCSQSATGESWLSNVSIIASFSDEKLKSSARYYREMARLFEEELLGRIQGTRVYSPIVYQADRETSRASASAARTSKSASRTSGRLNKTVKAIAQALDAGLTLEEIHSLLTKEQP
jgi:hypothetical protein